MKVTFGRLGLVTVFVACLGLLAVGCAAQDNVAPAASAVAPAATCAAPAVTAASSAATKVDPAVAPAAAPAEASAAPAAPATTAAKSAAEKEPAVAPTPAKFAAEPAFQDDFAAGWEKTQKDWRVATWKQNGSQMSPERCATDGKGFMIQTILAGEPYSGGSMQTNKEFGYGRWLARVKPTSVPGALNSVFTKDWDNLTTADSNNDGTGFEVDIEFLSYTFGPKSGKVHLAIHYKSNDEAKGIWSEDPDLGFNPSDDFHVWGFDILPDRVVWHVDGKEIKTWKSPAGLTIPEGHEFFFNSWTKPKWIKGPPKEAARYTIDWVKFFPLVK